MLSHSSFSSAVRPENFDKCCVDSETEEQRSLNIFVGILFEKCNYTPVRVGCVRLTKRRARYFFPGPFWHGWSCSCWERRFTWMFIGSGRGTDVPRTHQADNDDHLKHSHIIPSQIWLHCPRSCTHKWEHLTSKALRFKDDRQYALHKLIYTHHP